MTREKKLASTFTAALAVATLLTPSAFAENRHRGGTSSRGSDGSIHRDSGRGSSSRQSGEQRSARSWDRGDRGSSDRSSAQRDRSTVQRGDRDRSSRDWNSGRDRSSDRSDRQRGVDSPRTDRYWSPSSRYSSRDGWRGGSTARRYDRQPFWGSGRVSRYERWGGGYRVWLGGIAYPFWVPLSYYNRYPFRVGVSIRLGGYYNPLGYYEYYDGYSDGYRDGRYSDYGYRDRTIAAGTLRGVVESVDYRRGTFVLRNDATGNFVTVETRDRYVGEMREGDAVEIDGDWNRNGLFIADRVDLLERR